MVCCCLRVPKSTTKHGTPGQPEKPPQIIISKKFNDGFLILELGFLFNKNCYAFKFKVLIHFIIYHNCLNLNPDGN